MATLGNKHIPAPIALWLRHPLWECEVDGFNLSVGGSGIYSDMAGW